MTIDLKKPQNLTTDNVRELIASGDDSSNTQLRVHKTGIAYLSKTTGAEQIGDLAFRLETWIAGNNYVGEAASQDDEWVEFVNLKHFICFQIWN